MTSVRQKRAKTVMRVSTVLAWIFFVAGLVWAVLLLTAIGDSLTHTTPFGFFDWVVNIQTRDEIGWPRHLRHTEVYYVTRFFAWTFVAEGLGFWGFVHLRRKARMSKRQV